MDKQTPTQKNNKWNKEFKIAKGDSATTGRINKFLDKVLKVKKEFFRGNTYYRNYKVKIEIEELKTRKERRI
jgi:hypothetical protein